MTTTPCTALTRDEVREGDIVHYGSLGYYHHGVAELGATLNNRNLTEYDPDDLFVNNRTDWYANFIRAERMA